MTAWERLLQGVGFWSLLSLCLLGAWTLIDWLLRFAAMVAK